MKRRLTAIILAAALAFALCGCGSAFEKEYEAVSDYVPTVQASPYTGDKVTVRSFGSLKQAISEFVLRGETTGKIVFDTAYDGDATEDLASACWQIRTQNALSAYCVENMAYELNKIVTYYEATVHITYAESRAAVSDIVSLPYSSGLTDVIRAAFADFEERLVLLINASSYTEDGMAELVRSVYTSYPLSLPKKPDVSVNLYTGTGMQRLYEITLDYGVDEEEQESFLNSVGKLGSLFDAQTRRLDEPHRALAACEYLTANCHYDARGYDSAYSALSYGYAGSEGIALAYTELCRQLGIDCTVVYGQLDWADHCWNVIKLDGDYYHVDVTACIDGGIEAGFLKNDEAMWGSYRWNASDLKPCNGSLSYNDLR